MLFARLNRPAVKGAIQKFMQPYKELMVYSRYAMMEVETKFNLLNEEFSLQYDRNPIGIIKTRLKKTESLLDKMNRRELPITVESIKKNISDVAGVRVVCSCASDNDMLAESFVNRVIFMSSSEKTVFSVLRQTGMAPCISS